MSEEPRDHYQAALPKGHYKWKKETIESASDTKLEFIELKKRLREVEMEHDILKSELGHDFAERQLVTVA